MVLSKTNATALTRHRYDFVKSLEPTDMMLSFLRSKFVLTEEMENQVRARGTRESKVGRLLDIISHRSDDHFKCFISALVNEENDDLAKMLNKDFAEECIRERDALRDDRQERGAASVAPMVVNQLTNNPMTFTAPAANAYDTTDTRTDIQNRPMMPVSPDGGRSSAAQFAAKPEASGAVAPNYQPPVNVGGGDADAQLSQPVPLFLSESEKQQIRDYKKCVENSSAELKVCLPTMQLETRLKFEKEAYRMNSNPRGLAVIINNGFFVKLKAREGTDFDLTMLESLFTELRFTVDKHENLSSDEIRKCLSKISCADHSAYDAFVLVLLTHGNQDGVYGMDGDGKEIGFVLIDEITSMFDSSKCRSLSGKPKMFFIQACQGEKVYQSDGGESDGMDSHSVMFDCVSPHDKADVVIAQATVKGYKAFRSPEGGTCFIRTLVYVFNNFSDKMHLTEMLTKVKYLIGYLKITPESGTPVIQCPQSMTTLRKPVCFYPGT